MLRAIHERPSITRIKIREDRVRRLKISLLQWRISHTQDQLRSCEGCTERGRKLLCKLVNLVTQRNSLYTEAELRQMAKERGLL